MEELKGSNPDALLLSWPDGRYSLTNSFGCQVPVFSNSYADQHPELKFYHVGAERYSVAYNPVQVASNRLQDVVAGTWAPQSETVDHRESPFGLNIDPRLGGVEAAAPNSGFAGFGSDLNPFHSVPGDMEAQAEQAMGSEAHGLPEFGTQAQNAVLFGGALGTASEQTLQTKPRGGTQFGGLVGGGVSSGSELFNGLQPWEDYREDAGGEASEQ